MPDSVDVKSIIDGLHATESGGGCEINIRELVNVLGTGGYNRFRVLLARRGFRIRKSTSYTWAITKMPCDEAKRVIAELVSSLMGGEVGRIGSVETKASECMPRSVNDVVDYLSDRVLKLVPSLGDAIDDLVINLEAGNHVVLLGGPGSGKTLILDAIAEIANNPLYVNMADASAAGIEDLVIEAQCIDYLLLDELDKAKNVALSPLLQLLDHGGRLRVTKHGKAISLELPWLRVVAAANPFNPRLRSANWWGPLMDRLVPIEVPRPSVDDLINYMESVANTKMPTWVRQVIENYLDKVTLRKVEQAARYIATAIKKGKDEETIRAKVEKIMKTYAELTTVTVNQEGGVPE